MRYTRLLVCCAAVLAVAGVCQADPRWWQHDLQLTSSEDSPSTRPDVACIVDYLAAPNPGMVVVYEQPNANGNQDVWLLMTVGGCQWCPPRLWAGDALLDEMRPRAELGVNDLGNYVIQVVYQKDNRVWATYDDTIPVFGDHCALLDAVTPTTVQLSRPGPGIDGRPQITKATNGRGDFLHFHAAWQRVDGDTRSIELASDLTPVAWTEGRELTADIGPGMAADLSADTANPDSATSSLSLFFRDPASAEVRMSRSVDAGGSWSAPEAVSAAPGQALIAAASSHQGSEDYQLWTGAAWLDVAADDIRFDAAFVPDRSSPLGLSPGFEAADDPLLSATGPAQGPSLTIWSPPPDTAFFAFWPNTDRVSEIEYRAGLLTPSSPYRNTLDFPFEAERVAPGDDPASNVRRLSLCAWNEVSGGCDAIPRQAESVMGALDVSSCFSADSIGLAQGIQMVVFSDDRTGNPEIFFKLTDTQAPSPWIQDVTLTCQELLAVRADVTFPKLAECTSGMEAIERYFVYHGTSGEGGSFPDRVVLDEALLSDPHTETFLGLTAGAAHSFVLIAEDEARNIQPVDFDPDATTNTPWAGQWDTQTGPPCRPQLALNGCAVAGISCGGSPTGDSVARPGDVVALTVSLINTGDWEANLIRGRLEATGATVVEPPEGDFVISGPVGVGEGVDLDVQLLIDAGAACPAPDPTLSLDAVSSDGGRVGFGELVCGGVVSVDCVGQCTGACLSGDLLARGNTLRALKSGDTFEDVAFEWTASPDFGSESHINAVGFKAQLEDPQPHRPPAPGVATEACTAATPLTTCLQEAAIPGPPDRRFYRLVSACGLSGAEEGPF